MPIVYSTLAYRLIVGLFLSGASVIIFAYCQQHAKNVKIERRARRRNHQMILPQGLPGYEEPSHHPPSYDVAMAEDSVEAVNARGADLVPCSLHLEEVSDMNGPVCGFDRRPESVPPPYSLVDHCGQVNQYRQCVGVAPLQLRALSLSYNMHNCSNNGASAHIPLGSRQNSSSCFGYSQTPAEGACVRIFHSGPGSGCPDHAFMMLPACQEVHHLQHSELPPYESRPPQIQFICLDGRSGEVGSTTAGTCVAARISSSSRRPPVVAQTSQSLTAPFSVSNSNAFLIRQTDGHDHGGVGNVCSNGRTGLSLCNSCENPRNEANGEESTSPTASTDATSSKNRCPNNNVQRSQQSSQNSSQKAAQRFVHVTCRTKATHLPRSSNGIEGETANQQTGSSRDAPGTLRSGPGTQRARRGRQRMYRPRV